MTDLDFLGQLTVERLPQGFSPGAFCCAVSEINDYLHDGTAENDDVLWFGRTYVVLHENECVGYFTLLTDAIRLDFTEAGAAGSRYNTVPAIKLARLGVCKRYERRGIGRWIFDLVVGLGRSASVDIAVRYVSVDALPDEDLVRRYAGWGFVRNDGEEGARVAEIPVSEGEEPRVISMRFDLRQSPDGFSGEHRAGSATAII